MAACVCGTRATVGRWRRKRAGSCTPLSSISRMSAISRLPYAPESSRLAAWILNCCRGRQDASRRPSTEPRDDRAVGHEGGIRVCCARRRTGRRICFSRQLGRRNCATGSGFCQAGHRGISLALPIEAILREDCEDRILPFESAAVREHADIAASRRAAGRPVAPAEIAANARARDWAIATRNIRDFADMKIQLVDPWAGV